MTLSDQQVLDIVNALLAHEGVASAARAQHLRDRRGIAALHALGPLVDRYLAITDPPRTCQVTHAHWEGPMICGNRLPCARHGGG